MLTWHHWQCCKWFFGLRIIDFLWLSATFSEQSIQHRVFFFNSAVYFMVTPQNAMIFHKFYNLWECRWTNAALTVGTVLNWHSRNTVVGWHTCLAASPICITKLHRIAHSPTVFPWSAGRLILLLTLHLYQHGSNFSMISIVYTAGTECAHL